MVKQLFTAFSMCQSMFCAIPFPCHMWDEKVRDKMLLFLPLVGLEIGAIWACLGWLCRFFQLPQLLSGLVLCACPYLLTGFIHMDGFMDVSDAVGSCRTLERRREILKDSHVGSFAVIGCVLLLLTGFALFSSMPMDSRLWALIPVPVVSRCCSALAVIALKPMSTSQYAAQQRPKSHVAIVFSLLCLTIILSFILFGRFAFALLGVLAGYGLALAKSYRSLEGMNGDISGYCLTLSELAGGAVLVLL